MKIFSKWCLGRRRFLRFWMGVSAGGFVRELLAASQKNTKPCYFNVPAGESVKTLRLAAKQAKAEILVSAELLEGVRTRKIRGTFTPIEAFNFMLEETALKVVRHQESGVYAIKIDRNPSRSEKAMTRNSKTN